MPSAIQVSVTSTTITLSRVGYSDIVIDIPTGLGIDPLDSNYHFYNIATKLDATSFEGDNGDLPSGCLTVDNAWGNLKEAPTPQAKWSSDDQ